MKNDESSKLSLNWNLNRELSKINYRFQTDAIKNNLLLTELTIEQKSFIYADEADLLNVALFGMTASEWRRKNPKKDGNMRDYATIEQLLVLANLENINALYISKGLPQSDRITELNQIARQQLTQLIGNNVETVKNLK